MPKTAAAADVAALPGNTHQTASTQMPSVRLKRQNFSGVDAAWVSLIDYSRLWLWTALSAEAVLAKVNSLPVQWMLLQHKQCKIFSLTKKMQTVAEIWWFLIFFKRWPSTILHLLCVDWPPINSIGPIAKLKGPLFSAEFVCLSISDRRFYPSSLTDFDETGSQRPYSDLVLPRP